MIKKADLEEVCELTIEALKGQLKGRKVKDKKTGEIVTLSPTASSIQAAVKFLKEVRQIREELLVDDLPECEKLDTLQEEDLPFDSEHTVTTE